jgi:hypothetical protein
MALFVQKGPFVRTVKPSRNDAQYGNLIRRRGLLTAEAIELR